MAIGARDTTSLVTLTGWDAAKIAQYDRENGTTYADVVAMLIFGLGQLNGELAGTPLWGSVLSFTDRPEVQYMVAGSTNGAERHTEYARPDPQRANIEGHMLPLIGWDRALGWTWSFLRRADMARIEADIAAAIEDMRTRWRLEILGRILDRDDVSGDANGLGTSGLSPGFATAAANTGVDFSPPAWGGNTFTTAHEHYVPLAGGAFTAAVFQDARAELREHGHQPPYEFWLNPTDETEVKALTGFIPVGTQLVNYGTGVSLAAFAAEPDDVAGSYYIGTMDEFRVRIVPGMPADYGFPFKSYGQRDPRNPLRVRVPKGESAPRVIAMTDPRAGNATTPLQYLMLFAEYGVGVGADRTNGSPRYVGGAAWADGTPA